VSLALRRTLASQRKRELLAVATCCSVSVRQRIAHLARASSRDHDGGGGSGSGTPTKSTVLFGVGAAVAAAAYLTRETWPGWSVKVRVNRIVLLSLLDPGILSAATPMVGSASLQLQVFFSSFYVLTFMVRAVMIEVTLNNLRSIHKTRSTMDYRYASSTLPCLASTNS
jgi:hypothetical protein